MKITKIFVSIFPFIFFIVINVSAEQELFRQKIDPKDLVEVFIDTHVPTSIMGRLSDATNVRILNLTDLPKEMKRNGPLNGFPLEAFSFNEVSVSSDNTKIAFVVKLSKVFHADSGGWVGVLDLENNIITEIGTVDIDYLRKLSISPLGKYLLSQYDYICYPFEHPYYPIYIVNIKERSLTGRISGDLLAKNGIEWNKWIKEEKAMVLPRNEEFKPHVHEYIKIRFVRWSDDEKSIYFELIKVKQEHQLVVGEHPLSEILSEDKLGTWSIDLSGTNLRNEN